MNPSSNLLDKARARFELLRLSKGQKIKNISIGEIPKLRESFFGTSDEWQSIHLPTDTNCTSSIYHGKKKSAVPPHKHENNSEQLMILNEGGELKVITPDYVSILKYPNSVFFDKGEPHYVEFLEDTSVLLIWHPEFKSGWEAQGTVENESFFSEDLKEDLKEDIKRDIKEEIESSDCFKEDIIEELGQSLNDKVEALKRELTKSLNDVLEKRAKKNI